MRAARLLQLLLMLQNRGRMQAADLAAELEVSRRTILRDVEALNEAGLPVLALAGQGGGIELGFDYRTRLTGLAADEAEAMALMLALGPALLADLGLAGAARRAGVKLAEAMPPQTRAILAATRARFPPAATPEPDPRRAALALAVREGRIVRLQARSPAAREVHPVALVLAPSGWRLRCGMSGAEIAEADWGDVNISARPILSGRLIEARISATKGA